MHDQSTMIRVVPQAQTSERGLEQIERTIEILRHKVSALRSDTPVARTLTVEIVTLAEALTDADLRFSMAATIRLPRRGRCTDA